MLFRSVGYQSQYDPNITPIYYENFLGQIDTLQDHLNWQLQMASLSGEERSIGYNIIGNIDDDGYFREDIEEFSQELEVTSEAVLKVLQKIQSFDPVGIGACSLQECLLIQLDYLEGETELARTIIQGYLPLLQKKQYHDIAKALKISQDQLREPLEIIEGLEPKPGRDYSVQHNPYVTPDVYVDKVDGEFMVMLYDENLPRLRLSKYYQSLLKAETKQKGSSKTKEYLEQKLRSAVWLIKSVEQRQCTIFKVAESIVKKQQNFFEKGVKYLKPMVLRDVAEDIGMHESTISRVSNHKYIYSPQGIHEIRFFFHSGLISESGEDVSSLHIKEVIKQEIIEESPKKPLSDQKLTDIISRKLNLTIARRTVAKYRIDLNIPSSSQRKSLS